MLNYVCGVSTFILYLELVYYFYCSLFSILRIYRFTLTNIFYFTVLSLISKIQFLFSFCCLTVKSNKTTNQCDTPFAAWHKIFNLQWFLCHYLPNSFFLISIFLENLGFPLNFKCIRVFWLNILKFVFSVWCSEW